jgi:hypothetical protein
MTLATPTGSYATARANLAAMLAASSTFQEWVGADDATEAAAHIHLSAAPGPENGECYSKIELDALLPMAVVWTKAFLTRPDSAVGSLAAYARGSDLVVELVGQVDPATETVPAECGRLFDNVVGGIVGDLEASNGTPGFLAWRQIAIAEEPERGPIQEIPTRGDLWRLQMVVSWMGL